MGNQLCCEEEIKKDLDHTITVIHKQESVKVPEVNAIIAQHLAKKRPFYNELPTQPTVKQFGLDVYEGKVDERGRPHGYGKMYHRNGSVFIGEFFGGVADGLGHFVKPDGSYYEGRLKNNKAYDPKGYYWSPKFWYSGSIVDNVIDGIGSQQSNNHMFEGEYRNGQKHKGKLTWNDNGKTFEYEGFFNNEGNFQGKGKLTEIGKGTYEGDFVNGQKHGNGQYTFFSGSKYVGEYYHNLKEGSGKIIRANGQIAYKGEFKNGVPHGKGQAPDEKGVLKETTWVGGIDKSLIEE